MYQAGGTIVKHFLQQGVKMSQMELFGPAPKKPVLEDLSFHGVDIQVDCEFEPGEGESWDCPGSEPYVIVSGVYVGGVDIIDLLSEDTVDEIARVLEGQQ